MGVLSAEAWADEIEKIAVTLEQLRTAWKAKVAPRLLRRQHPGGNVLRQLPLARNVTSSAGSHGYAVIRGDTYSKFRKVLSLPEKGTEQRALAKVQAFRVAPESSFFRGGASPESREVFNRTAGLHEAQGELGRHFGKEPNSKAPRRLGSTWGFASHKSTRPPLQDLNIAATLEGPGREAAQGIRATRVDMEELYRKVPDARRLQLGHQRISRHAQKRLQEAYER